MTSGTLSGDRNNKKNRPIPSVPSKRVHETIKRVLKGARHDVFCRQTSEFRQPLKQNVAPKVSCLYVFHQRFPLIFRSSQLSGIFLAQKQHTCLPKVFLTSKTSCKEYFVERKQIKSTTAAYSKLRMFGGKTCHVCAQLELVFSSRVHA